MDELKLKKAYALTQLKLYYYINVLDNLLTKHITNSDKIAYRKIANLGKQINRLMIHADKLENNILCLSLIA